MENFYTAYTKTIDGVTFNFVKHYQIFPEYKTVPPLLKNYGMHTDFNKACKIAMIDDAMVKQQLSDAVMNSSCNAETKIAVSGKSYIYKLKTRQINLKGLLNGIVFRRLLHSR